MGLEKLRAFTLNTQLSDITNNQKALTQQAWIVPTLINSWVDNGAPYATTAFYKDQFGIVHIKGMIKNGVAGSVAFVLPVNYRPSEDMYFVGVSSSTTITKTRIVASSGSVYIDVFTTYADLNTISFRV